jgi:hypothetical protein
MRLNMRRLLGLSILLALYPLACHAESCANGVLANGETVELSGVLHHQVHWGPPNFGDEPETDSTFIAWIISLSKPLVIQERSQVIEPSVSEITLFSFSQTGTGAFDTKRLQSLDGKLIVATGKLWPATDPTDVTPVILVTKKAIKPTDQNICQIISEK